MPESSSESKPSEIDTKQRHPFLLFYFSALVFAAVLVFGDRVPSSWREGIRLLTVLLGAYGLWNFYQLFTLADERQRDTNNQALRFGFLATLVLSLLVGFVRGFGSPVISSEGLLGLMVIAWSVGLILFSWRYR